VANDIGAAVDQVCHLTNAESVGLIGTSFCGGIAAFFAARYPDRVRSLVLLNPLLNYKKRFVEDKPHWNNEQIDEEAGRQLAAQGFLPHSLTFKLGRPLLNEVFYVQRHLALPEIAAPTLFVHGTGDTFIPVASSREAVGRLRSESGLVEIEGAQHGFAVHDDPGYLDPQTQAWQAYVIDTVAEWVTQRWRHRDRTH
jgi:pimeloyl-ACP methyl ester carboxylesterase